LDIVRDVTADNVDDIDRLRGELPNGGARVIARDVVGEQETFELETAPGLLEPNLAPATGSHQEPSLEDPLIADPGVSTRRLEPSTGVAASRPTVSEVVISEEVGVSNNEPVSEEPEIMVVEESVRVRRPAGRKSPEQAADPVPEQPPVEELVVINILAPDVEPFTGDALFAVLRGKGLKFGEMNIFHRVDPKTRRVSYSVANVVEPGTFDMADMEAFRSPGLCFFLQLPGPENPSRVFEEMVNIARDVASEGRTAQLHDATDS
jgi:cell division protein ZipA